MSKNIKRLSSRKEAINTVENDDEMNLSYDCKKVKILPTFTEKDFVRKIWVELAKKEVPLDVFDSDFSDVVHNEHEILIDEISAKMVYQSDIGYNRNEPYIDYESYYEDKPYLTTESYYDSYSGTCKTRQVTKYKRVTKERPVTRYKNVIDWSSSSGEYCANSISIVENKQDEFLNERLFFSSFNQLSEEDIVEVTKDEAKKMQINDSTINRSECNHRDNIWKSLTRGLPGNHYRNLNSRITDIEEISCTLYKAIEYETTLFYDGKTYIYRAFPFGDMEIDGDVMETKDSLNKSVRKMENASYYRKEKRKEAIDKNINKRITPFSLLTIVLLLTSIIMSIFVLRIALMIIFFVLAVISFVLNLIFIQIAIKKENQKADKAIQVEETKVKKEILDLKKNYKVKQRELLNSKLKKLGLEPVSATELYQGEVL